MIVTAFGLDGFDDDGCDWIVEVLNQVFGFGETAGFFGGVFGDVICEWIFDLREWSLRPVEGWDIEFVDRLAASGGERAKQTTVEAVLERED